MCGGGLEWEALDALCNNPICHGAMGGTREKEEWNQLLSHCICFGFITSHRTRARYGNAYVGVSGSLQASQSARLAHGVCTIWQRSQNLLFPLNRHVNSHATYCNVYVVDRALMKRCSTFLNVVGGLGSYEGGRHFALIHGLIFQDFCRTQVTLEKVRTQSRHSYGPLVCVERR